MKLKLLIYLLIITLYKNTTAQNNFAIKLCFSPLFNNADLKLDSNYILPNNDTINIETCKFYISNIQLINKTKVVFTDTILAHLIDLEKPNSLNIYLKIPRNLKYTHMNFFLGIDSTTNVAEVLSGDLDPTNGMYWSWQSGYINFKLEGKSKKSPSRYKQFQYHLGGYLAPNNALQSLKFKITNYQSINFTLSINELLNKIDIPNCYQIMSPSETSVVLSKKIAQLLKVE